jgi:hypothetical protein
LHLPWYYSILAFKPSIFSFMANFSFSSFCSSVSSTTSSGASSSYFPFFLSLPPFLAAAAAASASSLFRSSSSAANLASSASFSSLSLSSSSFFLFSSSISSLVFFFGLPLMPFFYAWTTGAGGFSFSGGISSFYNFFSSYNCSFLKLLISLAKKSSLS